MRRQLNNTLTEIKSFCVLACFFIPITACSLSSYPAAEYPRKGEFLILHKALTIPADTTGLYLQDGQVSGSGHSRFEPYCEIRVRELKDTQQVIQPDSFEIQRSRGNTSIVKNTGVQVASSRLAFGISDSDGPSEITITLEMKLYSSNQPDVILLECGGVEDIPAYAYMPDRNEIQKALGKIATISPQPSK